MSGAPPTILLAGTHSGAGKTTVTAVVARALRARGLRVQPFKLGPDYIDPGYHREAAGRPSINLDVWMQGEAGMRASFARWSAGADVALVEAMGALYDGEDGSERGSAAHVAKLLGIPVVVVLDVWGMTRTTAAILDGLRAFDPDVELVGCVLNRVGGPRHARMVVDALPERLRALVVGAVPHAAELAVPERHLGLVTVAENATAVRERGAAQARAAELLDVERLLALARPAARPGVPEAIGADRPPVARLAIARDRAFTFTYEENLLLLRAAGFDLVPFSPLADEGLPEGTDAVYLPGGYPESFAAELAANVPLGRELRRRAAAGMPVHAECGGLMYLGRSLTSFDGERRPMAGVLALDVVMDPAHLAIRYVEARTRVASALGPAGTTVRGQEFHQSRLASADLAADLYDLTAGDGSTHVDGYRRANVVASYVHLHLGSNPAVAERLVRGAVDARVTIAGRAGSVPP